MSMAAAVTSAAMSTAMAAATAFPAPVAVIPVSMTVVATVVTTSTAYPYVDATIAVAGRIARTVSVSRVVVSISRRVCGATRECSQQPHYQRDSNHDVLLSSL